MNFDNKLLTLTIEAYNHRLCSFFSPRSRSVGRPEQQYRHRKHWGRKTRDPRSPSRSVLEVPAPPQPTPVPQVQHLPRQRCPVWSVHSQRPASLPRTGKIWHQVQASVDTTSSAPLCLIGELSFYSWATFYLHIDQLKWRIYIFFKTFLCHGKFICDSL